MKIQYCSDLHLEFDKNKQYLDKHPIEPVGEVLVMAGDIIPFALHKKQKLFIDFIADNFEVVYWVPGNHEYYHYDAATVSDPLLEKLRSNVWLINNQVVTYNNVSFICSTIWSKISVANEWDIQRSIADFFSIKWQKKRLTSEQFNQLHNQAVAFLEKAFQEKRAGKSIVVTHHVPTLYQYPAKYRNDPLTEAFASELYDTIHDSGAAYWIYGHHHCNVPEFKVGNTTLLTNQLGYVHQDEHAGFRTDAYIEV